MSMLSYLTKIRDIAEDLRIQLSPIQPYAQGDNITAFSIPQLDLTLPPELSFPSRMLGLPADFEQRVLEVHSRSVIGLQNLHQANYANSCQQLLSLSRPSDLSSTHELLQKLQFAHQSFYRRQICTWNEELIQLALTRTSSGRSAESKSPCTLTLKKRAFNQDYLPMLEAFFVENQFPSHADKSFMARKSGMTYKQIHVWFQNRRCRRKKNLKDCQGISTFLTPRIPPGAMVQRPEQRSIMEEEHVGKEVGTNSESDSGAMTEDEFSDIGSDLHHSSRQSHMSSVENSFLVHRKVPDHAFPTPYPPLVESDPFPCKSGDFTFPKPVWSRAPVTSHGTKLGQPDIVVLIRMFERMHLNSHSQGSCTPAMAGSVLTTNKNMHIKERRRGCDVTAPMTTPTYRAPLPFLVRVPSVRNTAISTAPNGVSSSQSPARQHLIPESTTGFSLHSIKPAFSTGDLHISIPTWPVPPGKPTSGLSTCSVEQATLPTPSGGLSSSKNLQTLELTMCPTILSNKAASRKVARLPRRVPRGAPVQRSVSALASTVTISHLSRHNPPDSRSSSFASQDSTPPLSRSSSSSSSSASSEASSSPFTPPSSLRDDDSSPVTAQSKPVSESFVQPASDFALCQALARGLASTLQLPSTSKPNGHTSMSQYLLSPAVTDVLL